MRILKILGGNDYGGQHICECQFIEYWKSKGVVVDAYILGEGKAIETYKNLLDDYLIIPELNAEFSGGAKKVISGIWESLFYVFNNSKYFKLKGDYDAVIYRGQTYLYIAAFAGKKNKTKVFWHLPNSINRKVAKVYYWFALRVLSIIPVANSKYTKESVGKLCKDIVYPGFNESRIENVKPNFREELGIKENEIVLGSAARIDVSKAQDILVKAFKKSKLFSSKAHYLIAGIPENEEFKNYFFGLIKGSEDRIHYLGQVGDMSKFYSSIDLYVNGRRDAEPFGISIAESLGAGKPVLAYYKGGPSEMIEEASNGWLVNEPSVSAFTSAFNNVDIESIRKMESYCRNSAIKFDSKSNAEKFLSLISIYNKTS